MPLVNTYSPIEPAVQATGISPSPCNTKKGNQLDARETRKEESAVRLRQLKKMLGITLSNWDSNTTLGTAAASGSSFCRAKLGISPGKNLKKWQRLFHALPTELHVNIMAQLHQDPVSQICFGLTASYFYWQVFHEVREEQRYGEEGKVYPIRCRPHDLRFQVSVCGQYSVFGWREYGYLLDVNDKPTDTIDWQECLGERLWEEWWLWGDLRYCTECVKYKPETAFGEFDGQQEMLQRVSSMNMEVGIWWLGDICKRCRVKQLCRDLREREEVREQRGNPWEERKSLGLKRLGNDKKTEEGFGEMERSWTCSRWRDECEDLNGNYETWESIFLEMGI